MRRSLIPSSVLAGGVLRGLPLVIVFIILLQKPDNGECFYTQAQDIGEGVLGFLRTLENTIEKKTLWFYRYFGRNIEPSDINRARLCDYSDPQKIKYCAPVFNPRAPVKDTNLHTGSKTPNSGWEKNSSVTSIPSKCITDPEDPECRDLRTLLDSDKQLPGIGSILGSNTRTKKMAQSDDYLEEGNAPSDAPDTYETSYSFLTPMPSAPIGAIVSFSPTRYMCYGNHDSFKQAAMWGDEMTNVRGKWCESSMPSVSLEPTGAPIAFPIGAKRGEFNTIIPTPAPTYKPYAKSGPPVIDALPPIHANVTPTQYPTRGSGYDTKPPNIGLTDSRSPSDSPSTTPYLFTSSAPSQSSEPSALPSGTSDRDPEEPPSMDRSPNSESPTQSEVPTFRPTSASVPSSEPTPYLGDSPTPDGVPAEVPSTTPSEVPFKSPNTVTRYPIPKDDFRSPNPTTDIDIPPKTTPPSTYRSPEKIPTHEPTPNEVHLTMRPTTTLDQSLQPTDRPGVISSIEPTPTKTHTRRPSQSEAPTSTTPNVIPTHIPVPSDQPTPSEVPTRPPNDTPSTIHPNSNPSENPHSSPKPTPLEAPTNPPTPSEAPFTTTPNTSPSEAPHSIPMPISSHKPTPSEIPTTPPADTPSTIHPNSTPSKTPHSTPNPTPSEIPTNPPTASDPPTPSEAPFTTTPNSTPTEKPHSSPKPTPSEIPTNPPTASDPPTPSEAPFTTTPNSTPTEKPHSSPKPTPSEIPTNPPTASDPPTPSEAPFTTTPNSTPTEKPHLSPKPTPSEIPTNPPTASDPPTPSEAPFTTTPNSTPTEKPHSSPKPTPSEIPTNPPTASDPPTPSEAPFTIIPNSTPTEKPHSSPKPTPSEIPTNPPTASDPPTPSEAPFTTTPNSTPTEKPHSSPKPTPSEIPTNPPTASDPPTPSEAPFTTTPNSTPTEKPHSSPKPTPSEIPTNPPTASDPPTPSEAPFTTIPNSTPTEKPHSSPKPISSNKPTPSEIPTNPPTPSEAPFTTTPNSTPTEKPHSSPKPISSNKPTPSEIPTNPPTPSEVPVGPPSSTPTYDPQLICEDDFVRFNKDGAGIPTDLVSCLNQESEILLPRKVSLYDDKGVPIGIITIESTCTTLHSSEIIITLSLEDGKSVTGNSLVSIQTPRNRVLAETTFVDSFFDGTGWTSSLPVYQQGKLMVDVLTEVNGEPVTFSSFDDLNNNICFDCGGEAAYFANPNGFSEYGFLLHAYADDNAYTGAINAARYMHTRLHGSYDGFDPNFLSQEVTTCIIIQENNTLTPYANSNGGNITFSFSDISDEYMEFELFNVEQGATVFAHTNDKVTQISVSPSVNEVQYVALNIMGVNMITIHFEGKGAICGVKTCMSNEMPPSESPPPTTVPPTMTSSPSFQPTDCYDRLGITEDDIINQIGSQDPIPKDAIKVIHGGNSNVTLEIAQLWSEDINVTFFVHYHSNDHESVCEAVSEFSYNEKLTKDLQCYDGWTDVGIFIYFDDEITLDECGECSPPRGEDENIVAYYFEVPCTPLCEDPVGETPSQNPTSPPGVIETTPPTDCYDLYGITELDIINQVGFQEPIPEDAIKIVHGENTRAIIEISQLWSKDINVSFFIHYHNEKHESVCEAVSDFSYNEKITKKLECYDGWTDVGVFIYFDEELTMDECEECRPPDGDDENVVAYYFEVPCSPICEAIETVAPVESPITYGPTKAPVTSSPTDCYDFYGITEDDIINQVGPGRIVPEQAIRIIDGQTTNATIEISQLWSKDINVSFFIHYHNEKHESVCEAVSDFSYNEKITKKLECYDGWTDVGVFIYFDEELTMDECEECRPPDGDDENVVAYYFEVPCTPLCEPLEPIESLLSPAPSSDPISPPLHDCYDVITEAEIIDQIGAKEPIPQDAIRIVGAEFKTVSIEIFQLWSKDINVSFFIHYHNEKHESVCEAVSDFSYNEKITKKLECYDGWTDVGVFIYFDEELTMDECEECRPPDGDDENVVAYYFEIPCTQICEPKEHEGGLGLLGSNHLPITIIEPTGAQQHAYSESSDLFPLLSSQSFNLTATADCHNDVKVIEADTGDDSTCVYSSQPFTIEEFGSSVSDEVRLSFRNNWLAPISSIELFYDRGDGSGKQCQSLNSLSSGATYPQTLAAACNQETNTTEIEVYVNNDDISFASNLAKCGNSGLRYCSYIMEIPCSKQSRCNDA